MSILLFIVLPLAWALFGKVLGWATAAAFFFNASGTRFGQRIGRWCTPTFPAVFLAMLFFGVSGNAGHGFTLLGSDLFFELACAIPIYGVLGLGIFAGALYVLRDLTIGHLTSSPEPQI